jgi:hypothetical protein
MIVVAYDRKVQNKKILPKEDQFVIKKKNGKGPTSQPLNHVPLLCSHPGESAGAGRVGLAGANIQLYILQD